MCSKQTVWPASLVSWGPDHSVLSLVSISYITSDRRYRPGICAYNSGVAFRSCRRRQITEEDNFYIMFQFVGFFFLCYIFIDSITLTVFRTNIFSFLFFLKRSICFKVFSQNPTLMWSLWAEKWNLNIKVIILLSSSNQ